MGERGASGGVLRAEKSEGGVKIGKDRNSENGLEQTTLVDGSLFKERDVVTNCVAAVATDALGCFPAGAGDHEPPPRASRSRVGVSA